MKAKVKLKIKYEGPVTFSKEVAIDFNDDSNFISNQLNYELQVLLYNIKNLNQSLSYWNISHYEITI